MEAVAGLFAAVTIDTTPAATSLLNAGFFSGVILGFLFGIITGFIIALRSKRADSRVTIVQILAILVFFGYLVASYVLKQEVQWVIAIAILATGYGVRGGEIIEKVLEKAGGSKHG